MTRAREKRYLTRSVSTLSTAIFAADRVRYHCCWWFGDAMSQSISSYIIGRILPKYSDVSCYFDCQPFRTAWLWWVVTSRVKHFKTAFAMFNCTLCLWRWLIAKISHTEAILDSYFDTTSSFSRYHNLFEGQWWEKLTTRFVVFLSK